MPASKVVCKKCGCPLKERAEFILEDRARTITVEDKPVKAFGRFEEYMYYAVSVHMPHTPDRCLMYSAMSKVRSNLMQSSTIVKAVGRFLGKFKQFHSGQKIVDEADIAELKKEVGNAVSEIERTMNSLPNIQKNRFHK